MIFLLSQKSNGHIAVHTEFQYVIVWVIYKMNMYFQYILGL